MNPILAQHAEIKRQYPDVIIMFRIGDFYEMFGDDAELAAPNLGITLTSFDETRVPMCVVPSHSVERFAARLVAAGYRVALCDQIASWKVWSPVRPRRALSGSD